MMQQRAWPKIAVVGAGAIGCYFGAMLARAGMTVTLVGRPGHVDAIARDGLRFLSGDADTRVPIAATTDIAAVATARLVLFCVKSLDTETAAKAMAPHLAPDAAILSLQNGVDNAERIRLHAANHVIPVLVYAAAEMPAPGTVRHTGGGNLVIGQLRQFRADEARQRQLADIAALFAAADVPVKIADDIEAELWTKLVMNCAYNAVCALAGAPYGRMVADPEVRAVMIEAVGEVAAVARAKGVHLPDDIAATAIKLADVMPRTMSSTAQDIAKGRRTEIDHLNGYVVRQGEALGIATPVNRTLNALIKLLEQSRSETQR
jgi:2-dehydropantoate 2-reductase